jgi:outer membrane protein OmpA-like peptidoglycan-associated protein
MKINIIYFTLFLSISSNLLANTTLDNPSHHEATSGGIGLITGAIVAGPIGAIIGGSMGVMTGHNQSKQEIILQQENALVAKQESISKLEDELSQLTYSLSSLENEKQQLIAKQSNLEQQHIIELKQFAKSYQFDLYFLTNSSDIHPQALQGLDKLAVLLQRHPQLQANLEAHSDWRGSLDNNCILAQHRLSQVNNQLTQAGVNPSQLLATNYGEQENYHKNSWDENLFYDRRVTISLSYFAD